MGTNPLKSPLTSTVATHRRNPFPSALPSASLMPMTELSDPTQQVTLRWLDGDLDAVTIRNNWRSHMSPEELGTTIVSLLLEHQADQPETESATAWTISPTPEPRDPAHTLALLEALDTINRRLDAVAQDLADRVASEEVPRPTEQEFAGGRIFLSRAGQTLVNLRFDPDWIKKVTAAELSQRVLEALQEVPATEETQPAAPSELSSIEQDLDGILAEIGIYTK